MLKRRWIALIIAMVGSAGTLQAQCPGYNPNPNKNLACAIATSAPSQSAAPALSSTVGSTVATQLSQLPIATAVSGAGLTFNSQLGVFEASKDLGPVLTQRGDTVGRHKFFLSFTYQRFNFDSVDGIDLKHLQIVNELTDAANNTYYQQNTLRVDFRVDQFVGVGTFGLTKNVDVSLIIPFSQVTLKSQRLAGATLYSVSSGGTLAGTSPLLPNYFAGSATGIGDVMGGVKANIWRSSSEKSSLAIGGLVRFPTGEAFNYLGTGAYGIKPYIVYSHRGRVTPNFSLAYQWNSVSDLNVDPKTGQSLNLPSSFMYSGGVDVQVVRKFSLAAEFLGQAVVNGPRLASTSQVAAKVTGTTLPTVTQYNATYAMNNASFGFKVAPYKGLMLTGSVLVKLDNAGLRANVVPMVGVSYRF
jgi:hypothetical protein